MRPAGERLQSLAGLTVLRASHQTHQRHRGGMEQTEPEQKLSEILFYNTLNISSLLYIIYVLS